MSTPQNPFPGPRPYERKERDLFFGRDELANRLFDHVLAKPCTLLYGPSGAGKSSLIQAAVFPRLEEEPSLYRVLSLDRWSVGDDPLHAVVEAMYGEFDLGDPPETLNAQSLSDAVDLAFQVSDRPLLISFDQIEQLLYPGRDVQAAMSLFDALDRMLRVHQRGIAVVLGIREDYLGILRDRLQGRRQLLDHGFRVGRMVVREMVSAVIKVAESHGKTWDVEKIRALVLQMRERAMTDSDGSTGRTQDVEDNDEVQAAFVQIVCRALWESGREDQKARTIVDKYLEDKLEGVGQAERRLLEDHLIDASGHRTMLTLQQAKGLIEPERAIALLQDLEKAAIVRGEDYRGDRRYELGHDWLAQRLRELRAERRKADEERAAQERLANARKAQRRAYTIAALAIVALVVIVGLDLWARQQRELARTRAIMAGVREHLAKHENHWAAKLLLEIKDPENTRKWTDLAAQVLNGRMRYRGLARGQGLNLPIAEWSPDGTRVLMVTDESIRVERVFGEEGRWEIKPPRNVGRVTSAVWNSTGDRIAFVNDRGALHIWSVIDGSTFPLREQNGSEKIEYKIVWGEYGRLIVWDEHSAEVWDVHKPERTASLLGDEGGIYWAGFINNNPFAIVQDESKIVALHHIGSSDEPIILGEANALRSPTNHTSVFSDDPVVVSPDGTWVVARVNGAQTRGGKLWRSDGLLDPLSMPEINEWQQFSPNGEWILGTVFPREIMLWDVYEQQTGKRFLTDEIIFRAKMSPGSTWIAASTIRGPIQLWKTRSQTNPSNVPDKAIVEIPRSMPYGALVAFSNDEKALLVYNNIDGAEVWNIEPTNEPRMLFQRELALGFNGEWIIDENWSIKPPKDPQKFELKADHRSPNREWAVSLLGSSAGPIFVKRLGKSAPSFVNHRFELDGKCHTQKVDFSPDSTRLAAVCMEGTILIWTISIPALQQRLRDANIDCLPPNLRQLHLDESETDAKAHYDECERGYGRIPFETTPFIPQPQSSAHP